jgi:hypothetical protein
VPQHQALVIGLGTSHGFLQADDHVAAEGMVARLDADDGDAVVDLRQRPQANAVVLPDRFTG